MTSASIGPLQVGEQVSDASFLSVLETRGLEPRWETSTAVPIGLTEATTVLALTWSKGVVMAGDRRATAGNFIAHKRVRKVYESDRHSAVAISGTAGMAVELIKLFRTELEHYEKIEDTRLSLEGKANFLARLVRQNLPLAFQGLVVVPLFCGFDERDGTGHLYTFDVVGGRYEEQDYAATGSGGLEARSFLKTIFRDDLDRDDAIALAIEGLVAASEEDAATGGPDVKRGIYPNVVTITAEGVVEVADDDLSGVTTSVLEARP